MKQDTLKHATLKHVILKQTILVSVIITMSLFWWTEPLSGKVSHRESSALRALFNTAGGNNWNRRDQWKGAPGTENKWFGVTCSTDNTRVVNLVLKNNRLSGDIPADIGDLTHLKTLVLSGNRINRLHPDLGKLSRLTVLDLSGNNLNGTIPRWIAKLRDLKILDLSFNRFSGTIPSWIRELKHLEVLRLDGNLLKGAIPAAVGKLSKLTVLRVGHNALTGEIPSQLARLKRLKDNTCNFRWNGLYTSDDALAAFLDRKQTGGNWHGTQTIAPAHVTAPSSTNTSVTLKWKPIPYTMDNGGYKVFYANRPNGPYTLYERELIGKSHSTLEIKGLKRSTRYFFVVRTWTDSHGSNRGNRIESHNCPEFTATTRGTTISGKIKTFDGSGVPNVRLHATRGQGEAFTDPKGNYHLSVKPGWSGTVTASKKGFSFTTDALKYKDVIKDHTDGHYTAEPLTKISGRVTDSKGSGVPGVTIRFFFFLRPETVSTDSTGHYIPTVIYNSAGTLRTIKKDYIFDPEVRTYSNVESARAGQHYSAYLPPRIQGRVKTRSGRAMKDVIVTFSPSRSSPEPSASHSAPPSPPHSPETRKPLKTDDSGLYSRIFDSDWSGSVKPSRSGYLFYPSKKQYKQVTRDIVKAKENYRAELDLKTFISLTGNWFLPSQKDFSDTYDSGILVPGIKAGYKFYRSLYLWAGYDVSSKKGTTANFAEPSTWKERFLSFGLGYNGNMSIHLGYNFEIAVSSINYSEKSFAGQEEEIVTGKAVGFRAGGSGIFKITDRLFMEFSIAWIVASDKIEDGSEDITIRLGGLNGGIGLGIRF
ncbi:MAG: hypothetical protein GY940_35440 [bacterium]|nr:hypothetical protein [bacterium]